MPLKHKRLLRKAISIGIVIVAICILLLLKNIPYVAEYVFARGISRVYIYLVGTFTSTLPFSLFELFILAMVVIGIVLIIKIFKYLRKRHFCDVVKNLLRLTQAITIVALIYTVTASVSYYRDPAEKHVPQYQSTPEQDFILDMVHYYIDDMNKLAASFERENGIIVWPYSFDETCEMVRSEFSRLDESYFSSFTPKVKPLLSSPIWSWFSIIGVSFQPTAEPHINTDMPILLMPHTIAHEISHNKGIMWESDAELIAHYITLTSENPYIRYSFYMNNISQIIKMLTYANMSNEIEKLEISPLCVADRKSAKYPDNFGSLQKVGRFFNDLYLKLSGASSGVNSYSPTDDIEAIENPDGSYTYIVRHHSNEQKLYMALYNMSLQ
ncbi:MAG: DUF3810 domain-containing protein [Christensenellaceae bacterium]|jgi:multidrug transporter EmrE-like cation transporter|nr:DUF3810 domain-containing protein [Christensenellaceae bacterium]